MDFPTPNDPAAVPASAAETADAFPRWEAAQEVGAESLDPVRAVLLPGREESPAEYLARLKNLHARAGSLIAKIEQRRTSGLAAPSGARVAAVTAVPPPAFAPPAAPVVDEPWPIRERRLRLERRIGASNRRIAAIEERRRHHPDTRAIFQERRNGPRDRRLGPSDRRREHDRRRTVRSLPWEGGLRLDRITLIWLIQVAAWVAIVVVALVYGLGQS